MSKRLKKLVSNIVVGEVVNAESLHRGNESVCDPDSTTSCE